jgi:adenylate cyclase
MSHVFISYAREAQAQAQNVAEALRALGHEVWRDDEIPAHRPFADVIEERLAAAKVVLVLWSADAAKSVWVRSEASRAQETGKLVQVTLDMAPLPMPFDQIQCANLVGWNGEATAAGWRKVVASIGELLGETDLPAASFGKTSLPLPAKPSIAVMPFANLSGDPELDAARAALDRFKSLTPLSPAEFTELWTLGIPAAVVKMYRDGIALAEGTSPAEGPSVT